MAVTPFGDDIDPPPGTIAVWSDPLADIPSGWAICDGNNGTPNMLDRYPKSVPNATTDPGTTGGQSSYSLTTGQLPSHGHNTGYTGYNGAHYHVYVLDNMAYSGGSDYSPYLKNAKSTQRVNSAGSHSHTVSIDSVGSGNSIDNRPKSQEVAFIQKL